MNLKEERAAAEVYIARADRRIAKERGLIDRSRNPETIAIAQELVEVLTILRDNVKHHRRELDKGH
jgi:hypothetical protein